MTDLIELKRCPFCGAAVNFGPEVEITGWHDEDCFFILLEEAVEITEEMNEEKIHAAFLRAWNRRADCG